MPIVAVLLAFSSLAFSHEPRVRPAPVSLDRPFFVATMTRLVPLRRLEFNSSQTATPVLDEAETRLYLSMHDGEVRCRFHGEIAWVYYGRGAVLASPLLAGETLYVAAADGLLTALNRITGEIRWQLDVHEELTQTPTLADGRVFVVSSDEAVTAVDSGTGKSLWKFRRERPAGFTIRGNARPVVAHGLVYAGYADGTVAALRPEDGVARWTRNVSGAGDYLDVDAVAAPADDTRVYAASASIGVQALDAASGEPLWTAKLPGANHLRVDGPRLYATGRGAVVALDRQNGSELWRLKLTKERYATEPIAMNGLVLFAEERGALIAVEAGTGRARGAFEPGSGFSQPVLAVPGAVFIVSNQGSLFSLGLLP